MSVATDKADVEVNWSVTEEDGSETEKATIDASGMLEAAQEGVVRVTAAAKDGTMQASKTIRIVANTIVDMTSYINDGKVVLIDSTPNRDKTTTVGQALALFDGDETNTSDFRTSDAGKGAYIAFDFGKRGNIALSRVRILARWDQIDRIGGAVIQGSQDGDAWTDLTGVAEKAGTWQELPVKDIGAYRYIRLYNSANWYGNAAELELYGAVQANEYHAIALDESMVTGARVQIPLSPFLFQISR